jgi:hypothetical protein
MKSFIKPTIASLLAIALLGAVISAHAESTNATTKAEAKTAKKHESVPFKGTIGAVDATGMTFTLDNKDGSKRTFHVTATTKIQKDGKTATLSEFTAGEKVTGSYKKGSDGNDAVSLYAGEKPKTEAPKTPAAPATTAPAPATGNAPTK